MSFSFILLASSTSHSYEYHETLVCVLDSVSLVSQCFSEPAMKDQIFEISVINLMLLQMLKPTKEILNNL